MKLLLIMAAVAAAGLQTGYYSLYIPWGPAILLASRTGFAVGVH